MASGTAFDLSGYGAPQPQPQKKPPIKAMPARKRKRARAAKLQMQSVCSFAIVVVLIGWIVLNQVWLTEVSGEINQINTQIMELESENARMLSELESIVSLRAIGEQAKTELGMNRLGAHQIIHISLETEDRIELAESAQAPSVGQRAQMAVTEFIARIQEYLRRE